MSGDPEAARIARLLAGENGAAAFDELRQTRDRIENILQAVVGDDGVLVQDFSGRITYANTPAARFLGAVSVRELLSTPSSELLGRLVIVDETNRDLSGELPGTRVLRGARPAEQTVQIRAGKERARWIKVRALPMHDGAGVIAASITILRDVTEQRAAADFREKMLGIVSHDLKIPLAAISLSAGLLGRSVHGTEPFVAKHLQRIRASGERAAQMVRDLLDLTQARLGGGIPVAPRAVDVAQLVEAMVDEMIASRPDRAFELSCEAAGVAHLDPGRVGQLLTNLLVNAATYGDPTAPIRVRAQGQADLVEISVHNQGPPIPPSRQRQIFDPFVRGDVTQGVERSVGLGLYIVKEIAEAHDGTIAVSSGAEGTLFSVSFPRSPVE